MSEETRPSPIGARASWGSYQASIQVDVTAAGNVFWSSQVNGQQGPAVSLAKTGVGPDFVYTDNVNLYGMNNNTGILWQQSLQGLPLSATGLQLFGDENGDFVIEGQDPATGGYAIIKFFGANGLPEWVHYLAPGWNPISVAVDREGDVYIAGMLDQVTQTPGTKTSIIELSADTGLDVLTFNIPDTYEFTAGDSCNGPSENFYASNPGPISVLSDDSAQMQYESGGSNAFFVGPYSCAYFSDQETATLNLVTISGGAPTVSTLDSSTYIGPPIAAPLVAQNLPDGNGGAVSIWSDYTENSSFVPTSYITHLFDSASGTNFTIDNLNVDYWSSIVGSTGMLYTVGEQVDSSVVLDEINVSTGAEAWRIPFSNSSLISATNDGGVVAITGSGVVRIDVNGNVTSDSDLTSYVGTSNGSLSYLGGPDATLWSSFSSPTPAVISDVVDIQSATASFFSVWMSPSGSKNANRAATNVKWQDADTSTGSYIDSNGKQHKVAKDCGGFDDTATPILVVPASKTNTVKLAIAKSIPWQSVTLKSDTSSVTISPPTAQTSKLTVTAGTTPLLARIKVMNGQGQNLATLRVAVKAPISAFLDLYPILEANENILPQQVPTIPQVTTALASFQKYANIGFTVAQPSQVSAVYDLAQPPIKALMNPLINSGLSGTEQLNILNAIVGANGNQQHKWMAYVHAILPIQAAPFGALNGFVMGNPGQVGIIGFQADPVSGYTNSGPPYTTAHETGHLLSLGDNRTDKMDQMIDNDPGFVPCRLHVDEWTQLNPTGNKDNKPQWEMAPQLDEDK